ncbi:MAG: hypothetical protein QM706_07775 [Nitrospira sp.]
MSERFSLSQEEEAQFRQSLLRKARKGDEKAKQELQNIYNVRIWSEQERAKLVYSTPQPKAKRGKPRAKK